MTQATYGPSILPTTEAKAPAISDPTRVLTLALAMAAADQRCPIPWRERIRLVRRLGDGLPLDVTDWQRWGGVVLTWLWETRPALAAVVARAGEQEARAGASP